MKYFVIFLILIGFTGFIIPQVFAISENLFSGTTTIERLPVTLSPNTEAKFEIKFQYTKGTYSLSNVTTIADITPQGAERFVHFNAESFDVYQNSIARTPVTISIDPDIEFDKIFLNISYVGTGTNGEQFKSSWFDSVIFDIVAKIPTSKELPSSEDYEFETLSGARCDGQVEPCYGTFYNGTTIPIQCDYRHSCGVIPFDNDVYYQPPLKQFKKGIHLEDIKCKAGLTLIVKYDRSPACVKLDTATKLIQRGWANSDEYTIYLGINDYDIKYNTPYVGSTDIPSANNQFALKFYSQISHEDKESNIFFSPTSLFTAFALAYEGARENTATEMQQVFGFEPNDSKRRTDFANMQTVLNPQNDQYKLRLANALWLSENFEPLPEYVDTASKYYDSKVESVDFAIKEKSLDVINQWVKNKTEHKIEKLFDELRPDTLFVITNAIYFNGTWANQFDKENTHNADFNVNSEKTEQVPMMLARNVMLNYSQTEQMEILEMPYQGDRLSMLILLPHEITGLQSLEESLTVENLSEWRNNLHKTNIDVMIPKFSLATDYDLTEILPEMGVSSMFDLSADFGKMTKNSDGLYIYKAVHKAFVDVSEEGTEGAAATGLAGFQSGPPRFVADHPFIFLIQDKSGQILFIGRVVNPSM
jgi:serpin B